MFFGEFLYKIDNKGRVAIPSKFRPYLIDGIIITRGFDGCLVIYTKQEWQKVLNSLSSLPTNQQETRIFQRMLLSSAFDGDLDSQGRILLPEYLRQQTNIKNGDNVIFIGVNNKIEVWQELVWNDYKKNFGKTMDKISQSLPNIGL